MCACVVPYAAVRGCVRRARYRSNIQQTLDYYQRLQDLTKQFNKSADDFVYAVDEIADDIAEPIDGTTVEQLTAIVEKFNTDVKIRVDGLNDQYQQINAVVDELNVRVCLRVVVPPTRCTVVYSACAPDLPAACA